MKYKEDRILFGRFITWNWPYIYITKKLHHRKCFVRILFTRCKTLETHSFATLTRSFLKFCDWWIKIRTAHFLWSNLFVEVALQPFCSRHRWCFVGDGQRLIFDKKLRKCLFRARLRISQQSLIEVPKQKQIRGLFLYVNVNCWWFPEHYSELAQEENSKNISRNFS